MQWDFDLSRLAQRWAENCVFDHDCNSCRRLLNNQTISVGQNAYALFSNAIDADTFWQQVMDLWLEEAQNFQYGRGAVSGNFNDVGHYTQIINAEASRVGCGAAVCGDSTTYAYCNYALGQGDTQKPFESGESCSKCSESQCKDNLCYCDKLCQNYGQLNLRKCECECDSSFSGDLCEIGSSEPEQRAN